MRRRSRGKGGLRFSREVLFSRTASVCFAIHSSVAVFGGRGHLINLLPRVTTRRGKRGDGGRKRDERRLRATCRKRGQLNSPGPRFAGEIKIHLHSSFYSQRYPALRDSSFPDLRKAVFVHTCGHRAVAQPSEVLGSPLGMILARNVHNATPLYILAENRVPLAPSADVLPLRSGNCWWPLYLRPTYHCTTFALRVRDTRLFDAFLRLRLKPAPFLPLHRSISRNQPFVSASALAYRAICVSGT